MKINLIPTYQQGGVYIPPYAVYQPIPSTSGTNTATASESKETKGLTNKDILQLLDKLDGLPNDMAEIRDSLKEFYIDEGLLGSSSSDDFTAGISSRYIDLLYDIRAANFAKQEYDHALKQVSQNGGIDEVAVNDLGQFVCYNEAKNDYKLMTAEQLKKSNGNYVPLTNRTLLSRRAEDPSLAGHNNILAMVQSGVGIEVVTDMIQKVISNLGADQNSSEGYIGTTHGKLIHGIEDLKNAAQEAAYNGDVYNGTIQDLYKYKYLTRDQARQATEAIKYIYNTLPANAKALLKYKSDLTEEGALTLIQSLISVRTNSSTQFDVNLVGSPSEGGNSTANKGTAEKDTTKLHDSQLVSIVESVDGVYEPLKIDRGDGIQMTLMGRAFNQLFEINGTPIQNTSMADMLSKSGIQGIIGNRDNITFGDQKVSINDLQNITYNNTGAVRANLPINSDGTVNLALLDKYEKVEAKLAQYGANPTVDQIKEAYEGSGLENLLLANGMPDPTKFGSFLVTEGYTTDALVHIEPSAFVVEYKGDLKKAANIIKESLTTGTGKNQKSPDIDLKDWWKLNDLLGFYDRIYKAAIYIPITTNTALAARIDRQNLDFDETLGYEYRYQNRDKIDSIQSTDSSVLGL